MKVLDNGNLLVLRPAYGGKGLIGDGVKEIGPDASDWGIYMRRLFGQNDESTRKMDRIRGKDYCRTHAKRFPGDTF
jgi:hypothetical protein